MQKLALLPVLFFVLTYNTTYAQVKNILLEEMSTTLCSFCPVKSHDLMNYAKNNPRAIAIIHHAGFGKDAMTSDPAKDFATAFSPYHFPSMTIDRIKFDSIPNYYTKYVGISMMAFPWEDTVNAILSNVSPVASVDISNTYNAGTRMISGNIDVTFLTAPQSGDFRINLYVIEDSVIGDTGNYDYDQKNNKTNDPNYPELYGKTLIQYYIHKNVVRAAPLGSWGQSGIIPNNPAVGTKYSTSFSYELPLKYDTLKGRDVKPEQIRLVAFISYYNADTWKRQVLNAAKVNLNSSSSVAKTELSDAAVLYPNPASDFAFLDFNIRQDEYIFIDVTDITGKKLMTLHEGNIGAGQYSLQINCEKLYTGTYFIRMTGKDKQQVIRLSVVR